MFRIAVPPSQSVVKETDQIENILLNILLAGSPPVKNIENPNIESGAKTPDHDVSVVEIPMVLAQGMDRFEAFGQGIQEMNSLKGGESFPGLFRQELGERLSLDKIGDETGDLNPLIGDTLLRMVMNQDRTVP